MSSVVSDGLSFINFKNNLSSSYFSFTNRWKEILTNCTAGVVTMLQKLVEIMPDTVVVGTL